jgi:hypothetical protein
MSAPVLTRVRQSTARAIEEAFSELWKAKQLDVMVREAEQAVAEYLDCPVRAEAAYYAAYRAAIPAVQKNEPINWAERGAPVREHMDSSLEALLTLRKWVRAIEKAGRTVPNAAQLDHAIAEMERVRTRLQEHWPWPMTVQEWAEAEEEIARGEGCSIEEAFAEAVAVTVEEWRRRVEEHRRQQGLSKEGMP